MHPGRHPRPRSRDSGPWFGNAVQQRARGRGRPKRGRRAVEEAPAPPNIDSRLRWYQSLFGACVDSELQEEQRQVEERLRTWSLARLKQEGFTLVQCRAKTHGRLFDKPIVRFSRDEGPLPQHLFAQGDLVTIARSDPLERVDAEGVVYEKRAHFVSAVFDRLPRDLTVGAWRLDKGTNKIAFERAQKALSNVCDSNHELPTWLRPSLIPSARFHLTPSQQDTAPSTEDIMNASLSGSALTPNDEVAEEAMGSFQRGVHDSESVRKALDMRSNEPNGSLSLNESQSQALLNGLASRLSLIQGPPGTGKTSTAVHLVKAWRHLHGTDGAILATAQSNIAVDQLLLGCLKLGLNAVRLGQPVRVTEEFRDQTLDARIQQHERMGEMEQVREAIQELHDRRSSCNGRDIGLWHRDMSIARKHLTSLVDEISAAVVNSADVICATCIGAGSDLLKPTKFRLVVMDECTQCTEPEALVALTKATRDATVVLIGDHQQLPPTVLSQSRDTQRILGTSLFQRLAVAKEWLSRSSQEGRSTSELSSVLESVEVSDEHFRAWMPHVAPFLSRVGTSMLRVQHRMHPWLSCWPSGAFYNGLLLDAESVRNQVPPVGVPWPKSQADATPGDPLPVMFVACTSGYEQTSNNGQSKLNAAQAKIVVETVRRILQSVRPSDIGVITPYAAQVQLIKSRLTEAGIGTLRGAAAASDDVQGDYIEVKTVDGYQGREKEVIIFSTVRSNADRNIGFLDDHRRFNVAMTRAKRGLVVIGNPQTLGHDPVWNSWLQFVDANGLRVQESSLQL